jgi:Tfp pilus assembly protein PilF
MMNEFKLLGRMSRGLLVAIAGAALLAVSGCASESGGGMSSSTSTAEQQLEDAATHYRQGDYAATIKRLQSAPDIWNDTVDVRVRAHKLLAFSYCVTNQRNLCRQQFTRILELSPGFELSPAEAGHPIWGGEFREAKRALGTKPAK